MRALLLGLVLIFAGAAPATAQPPAVNVDDRVVYEVASQLRCVVCQNLSVADSPSEMANQMRAIVHERLAAGDRPDQVIQYFVDKYGDWILLEPKRSGFTLLVWLAPVAAVLVGLGIFALVVRRWTRSSRTRTGRPAPAPVDALMQARIQHELEREGER